MKDFRRHYSNQACVFVLFSIWWLQTSLHHNVGLTLELLHAHVSFVEKLFRLLLELLGLLVDGVQALRAAAERVNLLSQLTVAPLGVVEALKANTGYNLESITWSLSTGNCDNLVFLTFNWHVIIISIFLGNMEICIKALWWYDTTKEKNGLNRKKSPLNTGSNQNWDSGTASE